MADTKFTMWLDEVNKKRKKYHEENYNRLPYKPLTYKKGNKYVKVIDAGSVWGFVSMWEGVHKGSLVCKGDLLKPASWSTPAKHSRGNIFSGSDSWNYYGPNYL
tara:strand:+ start:333 stop:644 length:312 start_codon:yes stop_codon:yes gene_type:complete